jgi:hypothetical protein
LWRCGDGIFIEVPPLASDALLTTLHPLLENVLQIVCCKLQEGSGTSDFDLYVVGDSSVGIALGYGLDDRGSRVRFPVGTGNFSLHHRVQNGSGSHSVSYPMGTRGSFSGGKAAGA